MQRRLVLAVAALTLAEPAAAQDTEFVKALRAHATPFEIYGGKLRGLGADAIARVVREHSFVMVGEDHGIREVPQFVSALWTTACPA